jgi:tetraacyldisaccharide 4'-kinase
MANPASSSEQRIVTAWYQKALWLWSLLPLTALFRIITALRRFGYRTGFFGSYRAAVPVVVVGNITVGGTGKTPTVIALVQALEKAGYRPGVISRGYGSAAPHYPYSVTEHCAAEVAGDEPLLIARRTKAPLVISPKRSEAIEQLLSQYHCDVIVADDGLQHYALQRDIELVVVDGKRGFGNGFCLPAGPLREPLSRLSTVDFIIGNGGQVTDLDKEYRMSLKIGQLINLASQESVDLSVQPLQKRFARGVHAVAGIGNPQRFFNSLRALGLQVFEHAFPDHHAYQAKDLVFDDDLPVIMTEKDAVKVPSSNDRCWYLPVDADFQEGFFDGLLSQLEQLR